MDKKEVLDLAKEKLTKFRGEFPELVREAGEGVCAKLTPAFYKAKAGLLGRFIPEKKAESPQKAVVIKDVEENTEDSRAKVKFTKGKITRSGVYLVKSGVGYTTVSITYSKITKDWWINLWPYPRSPELYANDGTDEWARLK